MEEDAEKINASANSDGSLDNSTIKLSLYFQCPHV
jgi:hypothetical protein